MLDNVEAMLKSSAKEVCMDRQMIQCWKQMAFVVLLGVGMPSVAAAQSFPMEPSALTINDIQGMVTALKSELLSRHDRIRQWEPNPLPEGNIAEMTCNKQPACNTSSAGKALCFKAPLSRGPCRRDHMQQTAVGI